MLFQRRKFILGLLSTFSFQTNQSLAFSKKPAYQVSFQRNIGTMDTEEFFTELLDYEDLKGFKLLNEQFESHKLILRQDFKKKSSLLTWTYVFKDENTYYEWEKQISSRQLIKKNNQHLSHHIIRKKIKYIYL